MVWLGINGIVGVPIALITWILLREALRSGVALIFGFRVFEIRWGAGPTRLERPIGPIDLALGTWPIAGASLVRSGDPKRHRLARAVCAMAPLATQFLWLAFRTAHAPPLELAVREGPAILAALDIANAILLAIHCLLPIELSSGVRSDVRLLLDSALAHSETDRNARASYYARLARHRLERGETSTAEQALDQGLTQLGREPLLVRCQERFQQTPLDSVVDEGHCADDLRQIIEAAEPDWATEWAGWTLGERLRQTLVSILPAGFLVLVLLIAQADRLSLGFEAILRGQSDRIAATSNGGECTKQLDRWSRWIPRSDRWFPLDAARRSERHMSLAKLEHCRGDLAATAAHQGEAMLAANAARSHPASLILAEPDQWLANELRIAELLRHAAAVEKERRSFRRALGTLGKAERRLETLETQITIWPDAGARSEAGDSIEAARDHVVALREEILGSLAPR
jgi:hypothetical protein